jgi:hypothetical protein
MSNKTISINPSLFSLNGSKTKKNREKKQRPTVTPLISPNVLKNKLLKRIKEHKLRETENLDNKKKNSSENIENSVSSVTSTSTSTANDSFTDEFSESINYLQTLSKQKKVNDEKRNFEAQKQRRRTDLERKTIKNRQLYDSPSTSQPFVNIDLPEELQEPLIKVNTDQFISDGTFSLKTQVPYGILKGGQKPTYRDWTRTQRNGVVTNPNAALTVQPIINTSGLHMKSERENRLQNLREKMKMKQLEESMLQQASNNRDVTENDVTNNDIMMTQNLIQKPRAVQSNFIEDIEPVVKYIQNGMMTEDSHTNLNDTNVKNNGSNIVAVKRITKKTIKRKYTLGKSKMSKSVAVLVKDRGTRKQILNAQKDLKRKQINDIKTYLREHNLIKVGSNAPNDVLRKLYESAMLAGEITNSNAETLLHNFSKNEK